MQTTVIRCHGDFSPLKTNLIFTTKLGMPGKFSALLRRGEIGVHPITLLLEMMLITRLLCASCKGKSKHWFSWLICKMNTYATLSLFYSAILAGRTIFNSNICVFLSLILLPITSRLHQSHLSHKSFNVKSSDALINNRNEFQKITFLGSFLL